MSHVLIETNQTILCWRKYFFERLRRKNKLYLMCVQLQNKLIKMNEDIFEHCFLWLESQLGTIIYDRYINRFWLGLLDFLTGNWDIEKNKIVNIREYYWKDVLTFIFRKKHWIATMTWDTTQAQPDTTIKWNNIS